MAAQGATGTPDGVPFSAVSGALHACEGAACRNEKVRALRALFHSTIPHGAHEVTAVLHLLCCTLPDAARLGMGQAALINTAADLLEQEQRHVTSLTRRMGDVGLVVEHGMPAGPRGTGGSATAGDVLRAFVSISHAFGAGVQLRKREAACRLVWGVGPGHPRRYVVRCLSGNLRCGVTKTVAVAALGQAAGAPLPTHEDDPTLEARLAAAATMALDAEAVRDDVGGLVRHLLEQDEPPTAQAGVPGAPHGEAVHTDYPVPPTAGGSDLGDEAALRAVRG